MATTPKNLLKLVTESILLREEDFETYAGCFSDSGRFIAATIKGQLEFVPVELLYNSKNKLLVDLDLEYVFGQPEPKPELEERIGVFYTENNLEWNDGEKKSEINFYIKPLAQHPTQAGDDHFFKELELNKIQPYAGTKYQATNEDLKQIGNNYASKVVDLTNIWSELILPDGWITEKERYWQVAGNFKSFTWSKIFRPENRNKKIFFCVGVHVKSGFIFYKLDCLRSGTHKLSAEEIRKFDHFMEGKEITTEIPVSYLDQLNWTSLSTLSSNFISQNTDLYFDVIAYIWNNELDNNTYTDKLYHVTNNYKSKLPKSSELSDDAFRTIIDQVVAHEEFTLRHTGKENLLEKIKIVSDTENQYHIESFDIDGNLKHIKVVATTGGTTTPFEIAESDIEWLENDDRALLYHIVEYNLSTRCGKMVVRKNQPRRQITLTPIVYTAIIG